MYKATVSGSFNRHLGEVNAALTSLRCHDVHVLSPRCTIVVGDGGGFVFLASDVSDDLKAIEDSHLRAIDESDFLWVVCPDGEIGNSTGMEIGYAAAKRRIPIFCQTEIPANHDGMTNVRERLIIVEDVKDALALFEKYRAATRKRRVIPARSIDLHRLRRAR